MMVEPCDPVHPRGYVSKDSVGNKINPKFKLSTDFGEAMLKTKSPFLRFDVKMTNISVPASPF